jgi:hypothetical protein
MQTPTWLPTRTRSWGSKRKCLRTAGRAAVHVFGEASHDRVSALAGVRPHGVRQGDDLYCRELQPTARYPLLLSRLAAAFSNPTTIRNVAVAANAPAGQPSASGA